MQSDGFQHTTNNSDVITGEYDIPKLNIHTEKMPMNSFRNESVDQLDVS
jgi:chaperone required for assembly of F1-ATPase